MNPVETLKYISSLFKEEKINFLISGSLGLYLQDNSFRNNGVDIGDFDFVIDSSSIDSLLNIADYVDHSEEYLHTATFITAEFKIPNSEDILYIDCFIIQEDESDIDFNDYKRRNCIDIDEYSVLKIKKILHTKNDIIGPYINTYIDNPSEKVLSKIKKHISDIEYFSYQESLGRKEFEQYPIF